MHWKIKRDSFYGDLYERYGRNFIDYAGFFEDECPYDFDIENSLNIPCTPLDYVRKNLDKPNPAIILATGCYNPIHIGHVEMMEKAKEGVEKAGYTCIGGFIAPDHDHYMKLKLGDAALEIHKRIKLVQEAIEKHDWLNVDPWAGIFHVTSVNLTDIITRLDLYIQDKLGVKIPIFFVCGGDNFRLAYTFAHKGHCIIVSRPVTPENPVNPKNYNITDFEDLPNKKNILFIDHDNALSSTVVRRDFKYPHDKRTAYLRVNDNFSSVEKFTNALSSNFVSAKVVHVHEQMHYYNKFVHDKNVATVSLDPFIEGDYNIGVSRIFDSFGLRKLKYGQRPHSNSWYFMASRIRRLSEGKCHIFDDDIDTGGSMDCVEAFLKERKIEVLERKCITRTNDNREVIDVRDFIYRSNHGGLVVTGPNGRLSRVPYVYPFVCPYIRASILNPMEFSIKIWELNIDYWERKNNYEYAKECKEYLSLIEQRYYHITNNRKND